jgi:hypothetical protein
MQWWYLYVIGGCAFVLVVFAHVDERLRERRDRADMDEVDDLHRHLISKSIRPNDFTSVSP